MQVFSQTELSIVLPSPNIGWDSLKNTFVFSEIARRAGLRGYYEVYMTIDSTGKIEKVTIYNEISAYPPRTDSTLLSRMLDEKIRAVKWRPAIQNGKPIKKTILIPILFLRKYDSSVDLLIKETPLPVYRRDY